MKWFKNKLMNYLGWFLIIRQYLFITRQLLVGKKVKGQIWKSVLQENKACQIFRKTNISYPLIRKCTCAFQGVRNVCFSKILAGFFSCNTRFEIRPFALLLKAWILTLWKFSSLPVSFLNDRTTNQYAYIP